MKFIDALNNLEPNELVYVGAKSNFLIIDTKENILSNLDKIETELHNYTEHTLNVHDRHIHTIPEELKDLVIDYCSVVDEEDTEKIKLLQDKITKRVKTYLNAVKKYATYTNYLKHWKELGDREVLDVYPHTVDEPGTTIIVKGLEQGELWWRGEK